MTLAPKCFITGLYRSGTSIVSQLFNRLGFRFSNHSIAGDYNNPCGYFEDLALVSTVEEIMDNNLGRYNFVTSSLHVTNLMNILQHLFDRSGDLPYAVKLPHAIFLPDGFYKYLRNKNIILVLVTRDTIKWKNSIKRYDDKFTGDNFKVCIKALERISLMADLTIKHEDLQYRPSLVVDAIRKKTKLDEWIIEPISSNIQAKRVSVARKNINISGYDFALVSAGPFQFGSSNEDIDASPHEFPQREIFLNDFVISRCCVSNREYRKIIPCDKDRNAFLSAIDPRLLDDDLPATGVTHSEAKLFCQKLSEILGLEVRLPTEPEWEKAARGADGRLWPWGNSRPEGKANFNGIVGRTIAVFHLDQFQSPYGLVQACGNCWEWTSTVFTSSDDATKERFVLKGGSFMNHAAGIRCADRSWSIPSFRSIDYGFRIVCPAIESNEYELSDL